MDGGSPKRKRRIGRAKSGAAEFRSPLAALILTLSLFVQLFAAAAPPAAAAGPYAGADDAAIAAELKAVFGDTAALCAHINDPAAPGKHGPPGHCCDQCPLCRSLVRAVAYFPPDAPALPERVQGDSHAIRAGPGPVAVSPCPARSNRARAPPFDV